MTSDERIEVLTRELVRTMDTFSRIMEQYELTIREDRRYLGRIELAARLGVDKEYLDTLVRDGLPWYRFGRGRRFLYSEVQEWIHKNKREAGQEQWTGARKRAS